MQKLSASDVDPKLSGALLRALNCPIAFSIVFRRAKKRRNLSILLKHFFVHQYVHFVYCWAVEPHSKSDYSWT